MRLMLLVPFSFALLFAAGAPRAANAADEARSLTLQEAVDVALRNNPALAAAEGREAASWAAHDRTAADRWPQLRLESRLGHVSEVPLSEIPGRAPRSVAGGGRGDPIRAA